MKQMFLAATLSILNAVMNCSADDRFKVSTKRNEDRAEVRTEDERTILDIRSPFGISHATIERSDEEWPKSLLIQIRLKGLESFKLSNEKHKLEATVSSHDGSIRLWKDGKEDSPLDAKSPYWLPIRFLGEDGKPTKAIPLRDGWFEIQLPKKFLEGNPKSFKVEWIDFYRN